METIFMNTEKSKLNDPHKVFLNLSQRLDLRSSNKNIALQNVSIHYTWKNTTTKLKKQTEKQANSIKQ